MKSKSHLRRLSDVLYALDFSSIFGKACAKFSFDYSHPKNYEKTEIDYYYEEELGLVRKRDDKPPLYGKLFTFSISTAFGAALIGLIFNVTKSHYSPSVPALTFGLVSGMNGLQTFNEHYRKMMWGIKK